MKQTSLSEKKESSVEVVFEALSFQGWSVFSIGFEVGVWFWEVGVAEAKYQQHFADDIADDNLTNWRQFFMRLSCYWSWISS